MGDSRQNFDCLEPYVVPLVRRVCRLWRDSQQLSRQQSEDIVREVSFLLERCVLRPFIFERAQEEATDWRCVQGHGSNVGPLLEHVG